ncbi:MAG: GGDEF domain-containing protein [Solirubrobacteraceae bacterium]
MNDSHGHAAGDAVLKDVVYSLRKQLRAFDLAYRLGGEEFLVLLPGADTQRASMIAEELRAAIAARPHGGLPVSISFGVTASRPGHSDYQQAMAIADQASVPRQGHRPQPSPSRRPRPIRVLIPDTWAGARRTRSPLAS